MDHALINLPCTEMTVWVGATYLEWIQHALAVAEAHAYIVSESLRAKQVQVFTHNHRLLITFHGPNDTLSRVEFWGKTSKRFLLWKNFLTTPPLSSRRMSLRFRDKGVTWTDRTTGKDVARLASPSGTLELLSGWKGIPPAEQDLILSASGWMISEMPEAFRQDPIAA